MLKEAELFGQAVAPSSVLVSAATGDALLAALAIKDAAEIKLAFENNACVGLVRQRGGAPKIPELAKEVEKLRTASALIEGERAAVHAALDAARRGDRVSAERTARAGPIAPGAQGRLHDYAEQQRTTDDFVDLCR